MTDADELAAAVDRLRRMAYAECDEDAYQHNDDCKLIAHAYLALGTRQPDTYGVFQDGCLRCDDLTLERAKEVAAQGRDDGYEGAVAVKVITFIQEVQG